MNYMALARVWRPKTFAEFIGQNAIKTAIENALNKNRLHHAYLFTGTRGVGKTSIARLFAKALNCEQGISATPCLECSACKDVEQGNYIDLIEIDGASKTKVEDTRELLENIHYSPVSGRFKIYLIDEVHMLSQHSFNALLKTLEEPPQHVKFLLATTDPQKLPLTILSRCLNFNLKPLSDEAIGQQLTKILSSENITCDAQALLLLSKTAKGSMRDALSLLDQVITLVDTQITLNDVRTFLGYTSTDYALEIIYALATINPDALVQISNNIATEGGNVIYVLEEVIQYLHKIAIKQILSDSPNLSSTSPVKTDNSDKAIVNFSAIFTPEEVQLLYEIALKGLESIHIAPTRRIGFEMTLLRMFAFRPMLHNETLQFNENDTQGIQSENSNSETNPSASLSIGSSVSIQTQLNSSSINENVEAQDSLTRKTQANENNKKTTTKDPITPDNWKDLIAQFNLSGLAQNVLSQTKFVAKNDNVISLEIHANNCASITPAIIKRIEDGMSEYFNEKISLKINEHGKKIVPSTKEKTQSLIKDPFFQHLQEEFSAALIKNSITLNEEDNL